MAVRPWQSKTGVWYADIPDAETGKRRRVNLGRDQQRAEERFHREMAAALGAARPAAPVRATVRQLSAAWLASCDRQLSPNTVQSYRTYSAWLLRDYGDEPAAGVGPAEIERILEAHAGNSGGARNHFLRAVKAMYSWGVQHEYLPAEANRLAQVRAEPHTPKRPEPLDAATCEAFLTACDRCPPLGAFARLLLYTGMRAGELVGLPWSAWRAHDGMIYLAQHKASSRTGKPRRIPVSSAARTILETLPRTGGAVFSDEAGTPLPYWAFNNRLRKVRRARPEFKGVTFHALRHTAASRMHAAGVPLAVAQEVLGHGSTLMTLYYTHNAESALFEAVEALSGEGRHDET